MSKGKQANAEFIVTSVITGVISVFGLTCVIYDGTKLKYKLDYEEYKDYNIDYNISGQKSFWANCSIAALAVVVLVLVSCLTISRTSREVQTNESKKRRKIRHCDIWLPQIVMTLVEVVVNVFSLTAVLGGCFAVLRYYNICSEYNEAGFKKILFGKVLLENPFYKWLKGFVAQKSGIGNNLFTSARGFWWCSFCSWCSSRTRCCYAPSDSQTGSSRATTPKSTGSGSGSSSCSRCSTC